MGFSKKNIDKAYRSEGLNRNVVKYITVVQGGGQNGNDGKNGENAINVTLSKPNQVFESVAGYAIDNQTDHFDVIAYNGSKRIDTSIGDITGTISGALDVSVNNEGTSSTSIDVSVSNNLSTQSGQLGIPVILNLMDPRDASGNKDASYWDASAFDLTTVNLTYDWKLINVSSGVEIYALDLSNQVAAVNCDSSGHVISGAHMPECSAELTLNGTRVADASYSIEVQDGLTGVTINSSTGILSFDASTLAWDTNSTIITVKGWEDGSVKDIAHMTLIKSLPGGQGQDAVSYWLNISAPKIKVDPNNNDLITPSTITATGYKQVGANSPVAATDCVIYWGYETTTPTTLYRNTITNIDKNKEYIYFTLKKGIVVMDEELVPILWEGRNGTNGRDGSTGKDGQNAYRLDLTNENMSINCDASGNILPTAYIPSSVAKLYYGGDIVSSGVVYSIESTSSTIPSGSITINSSTGQITINHSLSFDDLSLSVVIKAVYKTITMRTTLNISKSMPGLKGDNGSTPYIQNGYWYINGVSTGIKAEGQDGEDGENGITPTIGENGHWFIGTTDTGVLARGADGVSITNVYEYYATSVDTTQPPLHMFSTTFPDNYGEGHEYLWNYERILYSNNNTTMTTPAIISKWGKDGSTGQAGRGIRSITEYYAINDSSTTAPSSWTTSFVAPTDEKRYLWNYEHIEYTDGSHWDSNKAIIGIKGQNGIDGNDGFTPYIQNGYWYINGVSTGIPATGENGITPTIGDNGHWFIGTTDTGVMAQAQDGVSITGTEEYYAASASSILYPILSSFITTIPSDYGPNKPYLWNYEKILYSNDSSTISTPCIIGTRGNDGSAGRGISSIVEYYAINDSSTTAPTTWSTSMQIPTDEKKYLWNKERINYTDGGHWESSGAIIGIKGQDGSAGADAVSYWLEMSANEVYVDVNNGNACDPSAITIKAMRQVGGNTPTELTPTSSFVKYSPDASYGTTVYTGPINPANFVPEHKFLTVSLYINSQIRDNETIQLLRNGKNGEDGTSGEQGLRGAVVRGPIKWIDSSIINDRRFSNGEPNIDYPEDASYIDLVITEDGSTYMCSTSFNGSPIDTWNTVKNYFTAAENFKFVATDLLLSKNAKINFLTNNELYLVDSSSNITGGAKGTDSSGDVNFWAGSNNPNTGKFKVLNNGKLIASDASITGEIHATGGTFDGYIFRTFTNIPSLDYTINRTDNLFNLKQGSQQPYLITLPNDQYFIGKEVSILSPVPYTSTTEGANMVNVKTTGNSYMLNIRKTDATSRLTSNKGFGACKHIAFKGALVSFICVQGNGTNVDWILSSSNDGILYSSNEYEEGYLGYHHNGIIALQGRVSMNSTGLLNVDSYGHPSSEYFLSELGIEPDLVTYTYNSSNSTVTINWSSASIYLSGHMDTCSPIVGSATGSLKMVVPVDVSNTLQAQFKIYDGSWSSSSSKWCSFNYTIYAIR